MEAAAQQVLFVERPDERWEFVGETFEQHVDNWQEVDGQVQKDKWKLASVAASLTTRYNDKTVDRFAYEARRSARRVREYAQTWRAFENGGWAPILSFTHHVAAASHKDPVKAIGIAEDKEWSAHELKHWVATGEEPKQKEPKKPTPKPSPELQKIHDDAVKAELNERIAIVEAWTEPVDPLLSRLYRHMAGLLKWQRDRTVEVDCKLIVQTVKRSGGQMEKSDLYQYLLDNGYVMSEAEFDERLHHMNCDDVRMALVTDAGPGKQDDRRGKMPTIIAVPWAKVWDQGSKRNRDEDDEED